MGKTQTPIETLRRTIRYQHSVKCPIGKTFLRCGTCAGARTALEDVEALVAALQGNAELHHKSHWDKHGAPLIPFADCDDDRCYVNRDALAKFTVKS